MEEVVVGRQSLLANSKPGFYIRSMVQINVEHFKKKIFLSIYVDYSDK